MKKIFRKDGFLYKSNKQIKKRLGQNIYTILGIMAILLVFSGLVIGLLGRGWLGAWTLVLLGLILGFYPCVDYITYEETNDLPYDDIMREALNRTPPRPRRSSSVSREDVSKTAIEFEALLARQRLKRMEEEKKRQKEEQEERERLLRIQREAELDRLKRAEKKRQRENEEKARRKRLEEERQRQRQFNQNVFHGSIARVSVGPATGFFKGIKNSTELKKRYKELVKLYHPDNNDGNTDKMHKLKAEYDEMLRFFESYEKHAK